MLPACCRFQTEALRSITGETKNGGARLVDFLGVRRNLVLLLVTSVLVGAGEEMSMRFVPKYPETPGAGAPHWGLYDGLKTLLGAVYAYPGSALSEL